MIPSYNCFLARLSNDRRKGLTTRSHLLILLMTDTVHYYTCTVAYEGMRDEREQM